MAHVNDFFSLQQEFFSSSVLFETLPTAILSFHSESSCAFFVNPDHYLASLEP